MKTVEELVTEAKSQITEIDVASAEKVLCDGRTMVIDVREGDEFAAGAIPNAIHVPRGVLEFRIHNLASADTPLLVYCKSGGRAALAAQSLQSLGYQRVSSLAGGYLAWEAAHP